MVPKFLADSVSPYWRSDCIEMDNAWSCSMVHVLEIVARNTINSVQGWVHLQGRNTYNNRFIPSLLKSLIGLTDLKPIQEVYRKDFVLAKKSCADGGTFRPSLSTRKYSGFQIGSLLCWLFYFSFLVEQLLFPAKSVTALMINQQH